MCMYIHICIYIYTYIYIHIYTYTYTYTSTVATVLLVSGAAGSSLGDIQDSFADVYRSFWRIYRSFWRIYLGLFCRYVSFFRNIGWLRLVASIKLKVSIAKEPYKRDDILQKRPIILSILLTVATP